MWDWIDPKALPVARRFAARIERRRYDVAIRPDRPVAVERRRGGDPGFHLLYRLARLCGLGARKRHPGAASSPWQGGWQPRRAATPEELTNELARLHETIVILRNRRRQAEVERDRWEQMVRALEAELAELRSALRLGNRHAAASDKFRRAKNAVARLTHPDTTGATGIEARIRERLFKEFWAEFERIETEP